MGGQIKNNKSLYKWHNTNDIMEIIEIISIYILLDEAKFNSLVLKTTRLLIA